MIFLLVFSCRKKWLSHLKQHYPNDPKVYSQTYRPRRIKIEPKFNYKWMHCQYCFKGFTKMQKLFVHQRVCHMELTAIECYRCKEKLLRMNRLLIHMRKRHRNAGEPSPDDVICHMCGLTVRKPNLQRHLKVSHANGRTPRQLKKTMKISQCFYCSETFRMEVWLHKHVETIHPQFYAEHLKRHCIDIEELKNTKKTPGKSIYSKRNFQCTTCGIRCANSQMLKDHRDNHKNHECNICKKKFFGLQNLELHLKQHSDKDRPFICEVSSIISRIWEQKKNGVFLCCRFVKLRLHVNHISKIIFVESTQMNDHLHVICATKLLLTDTKCLLIQGSCI